MSGSSDLLAAGAHLDEHHVEALLVDQAQAGVGQAHLHPAVLALDPELAVLEVGQETPLGLVVGVGHVVSAAGGLPRDLANAGHGNLRKSGRALTKDSDY